MDYTFFLKLLRLNRWRLGMGEEFHPTSYPSATWGLLILMWRLWTCFHHKDSYPSSPPAHVSSPPDEEFTIHVSGASCYIQVKPGPDLNGSESHGTQWPGYDPLDVWWNHQRPSRLAWPPGGDAALRAGEGTPHPLSGMALPCRTQECLIEESPETLSRRRSWPWWL